MAELMTRIVLRNDSTQNWSANADKVLQKGEVAFEFLENGEVKMKVGDGVKTWGELSYYGGGASYTQEELEAIVSEQETKVTALEEIVTPSGEDAVPLISRIEAMEEALNGTGENSVDAKIEARVDDKLAEFASSLTDNGKVDTLMELINYVEEHGEEAANMASEITTLQELVGAKSVAEQIADAGKMYRHVKYEIAYKPTGTLVDYRDKEIRVMCPADTQWKLQTSGENADPNLYYIGFKAYAPAGAVNFKEDLAEIITDSTMYSFEGNDFAGTDELGRKYSIVWLPVARYDAETLSWNYYGMTSSRSRYIGWYYSVEWYDANGLVIGSDTIRINLSNENCHSMIEPYYMANVIKEISVNGTTVEAVNGKVDIPAGNVIKSSDEIIVNEDGTLEIKAMSIDKLIESDENALILNGGGADA